MSRITDKWQRWKCRHGEHEYDPVGYTPETDRMLMEAARAGFSPGDPGYRLGVSVELCRHCGHTIHADRRIYLT